MKKIKKGYNILEKLVSIVIPMYNVEEYIAETLESVIKQSYTNLEIIIVNDGSKDQSLTIAKRYSELDKRIVLIDKKNEGLSKTREEGLKRAHGEYVAMIDSDDKINKDYIRKMYDKIEMNKADICLCARKTFGLENHAFMLNKGIKDVLATNRKILEKDYYHIALNYEMSDSWNKLYRRHFLKEAGCHFYLDRKYNGTDMLFNYMLLLHCPKIVTVNEPLYEYRIIQNSRVRRKNKPLQEGFNFIYNELKKEAEKLDYSNNMNIQLATSYVSMMKYVTQDIVEEEPDKELREKRLSKCLSLCHKYKFSDFCKIIYNLKSFNMSFFFLIMNIGFMPGLKMYYRLRSIRNNA